MRLLPFNKSSQEPRKLIEGCVLLRPASMDDFSAWRRLRLQSREFLQPWEPLWNADELGRGSFRIRLSQQRSDHNSARGAHWLIFSNDEAKELLGGIAITNIRRNVSDAGTLGYWMGQPHAGKGYMKLALTAVCREASSGHCLTRLEAATLIENRASQGVLLSCGFHEEGRSRAYMKINGNWRDHILYARVTEGRRVEAAMSDRGQGSMST